MWYSGLCCPRVSCCDVTMWHDDCMVRLIMTTFVTVRSRVRKQRCRSVTDERVERRVKAPTTAYQNDCATRENVRGDGTTLPTPPHTRRTLNQPSSKPTPLSAHQLLSCASPHSRHHITRHAVGLSDRPVQCISPLHTPHNQQPTLLHSRLLASSPSTHSSFYHPI